MLRPDLLRMTMCTEIQAHGLGSQGHERDIATAAHFQRTLLPPWIGHARRAVVRKSERDVFGNALCNGDVGGTIELGVVSRRSTGDADAPARRQPIRVAVIRASHPKDLF